MQQEVLDDGSTEDFVELERPSQLSENVDFGGLSLQAFAEDVSAETMNGSSDDRPISAQTVEECEYV